MNESKLPIDGAAPLHSAEQRFVPSTTPAQRVQAGVQDAPGKADRVAIGEQTDGPVDVRADSLSPEAIAMYRARLARGYYGTPMVMRALAERLLESGDL